MRVLPQFSRLVRPWMIVALGLALAGLILWLSLPEKRWNDSLGTASQVFLAAVVAAFGVSQIILARAAVSTTKEQNEIMREQRDDARDEAVAAQADAVLAREHAGRTLRATIRQRLDAQAPRVFIDATEHSRRFEWRSSDWKEGETGISSEPTKEAASWTFTLRFSLWLDLIGNTPAQIAWRADDIPSSMIIGEKPPMYLNPRQRRAELTLRIDRKVSDYPEVSGVALDREVECEEAFSLEFEVSDLYGWVTSTYRLTGTMRVLWTDGNTFSLHPERNIWENSAHAVARRYPYFDSEAGQLEVGG